MAENYKPVVVGSQTWPLGVKELQTHPIAGVDIVTDSVELNHQLGLLSRCSLANASPASASLLYVVDGNFPFTNRLGGQLRRIEKNYPGDIYAAPNLSVFAFHGIDKFGTLASMAYGIRAWKTAQNYLGLHSSLVFDKDSNEATLLVAKNRAGKSSIGRALEETDERFDLLSDDWNEVSLANGRVTPISPVFSVDSPGSGYDLLFESFGKPFYTKPVLPGSVTLARIVEIHTQQHEDKETFLKRSLGHIPLIAQTVDENLFADDVIDKEAIAALIHERKKAIMAGYTAVASECEVVQIVNDPQKNSLNDVVQRVREVMV